MAEESPSSSSESSVRYVPYELNYLPEELKRRAESELFEDEATRKKSLQLLRTMLKEENDLYWQDDDLFLLAFLRARKFDVKRAFSLMKNFYHVMKKHEELYHNFDFEKVRKTIAENFGGALPYRDEEGCVIFIMKMGAWDPHLSSMGDCMRVVTCALLHAIRSPATQVAGFKVIMDFNEFTLSQLPHISPTYLWLLAETLQNCFPGRFRAVHVVNEGPLFTYIWIILKQFLTRKIRERIHCHGKNVKKLHKYFHPSILFAEYEGKLPPFDIKEWSKQMDESAEYITSVFSYGYNKHKSKGQE